MSYLKNHALTHAKHVNSSVIFNYLKISNLKKMTNVHHALFNSKGFLINNLVVVIVMNKHHKTLKANA